MRGGQWAGIVASMSRAGLAAVAFVLVAACAPASWQGAPLRSDPIIDGWPIGAEQSCTAADERCAALIPVALSFFKQHNRDDEAVVRATLHDEGSLIDANGKRLLITRTGECCSVAVLELADGSIRAIGVGYPGVSETPMAFEIGP